MRFRVSAPVLGEIYIQEIVLVDHKNVLFEFIPDKDGRLSEVALSCKIDPKKVAETVEVGTGNVKFNFKIDDANNVYQDLLAKLKSLESQFAISTKGDLHKVIWEKNTRTYIPETEEETNLVSIRSINLSKTPSFPKTRSDLNSVQIEKLVGRLDSLSKIDIPLAFWREGMNELRASRFIQAFFNFYFVIEGFYANGKSSAQQVRREFQKSADLNTIITQLLPSITSNPGHKDNLQILYKKLGCSMDITGTIEFLVKIRGTLHHISFQSQRLQGTPLNNDDFVSIAVLSRSIASPALELRARELLKSQEHGMKSK